MCLGYLSKDVESNIPDRELYANTSHTLIPSTHCGACKSRLVELCRASRGTAKDEAGKLVGKQMKKRKLCFTVTGFYLGWNDDEELPKVLRKRVRWLCNLSSNFLYVLNVKWLNIEEHICCFTKSGKSYKSESRFFLFSRVFACTLNCS